MPTETTFTTPEDVESLLAAVPESHRTALAPWLDLPLDALIRRAIDKTSIDDPDWIYTAAQILRAKLYREAAVTYRTPLADHIRAMVADGLYTPRLLTYSVDELRRAETWLRPERDGLFHYAGLKSLADRYLVRDGERLRELPQHRFMAIALDLAAVYGDARIGWAERFYEALSTLRITVATPILANGARPAAGLASCFIDTVDDDLASIFRTNAAFAQVSKWGGGMGIYLGHVRGRGAPIRGIPGAAGGVVPWVRTYNQTAASVDQLGVRAGAVSVWLDVWHPDVLDFLEMRTNNGDPRLKAHDVFPGLSVPDAFMRAVEADEPWYLVDPKAISDHFGWCLEDSWGAEFEARYAAAVRDPAIEKTAVEARDLMKRIMRSAFETGTPFLFFRDAANRLNPNKHAGMVYASNLCTEIIQNMAPSRNPSTAAGDDGTVVTTVTAGDFVVCTLASLNLGRLKTAAEQEWAARTAVRLLDAVIDLNAYPVPEAEITAKRYRAIGIGVSGYHQRLVQDHIDWESEAHLEAADAWFETIHYAAIDESSTLAGEKGAYPRFAGSDWETGAYFRDRGYDAPRWQRLAAKVARQGLRNGYLMAIAPTSSTSLIAGSTAGIDPVFGAFYWEEKRGGLLPQVAPAERREDRALYRSAHRIDQRWSIRAAAVRQRHLDQSQSLNLYITPELGARQFLDLYLEAWRQGLKTLYYVRSRSLEVIECESCSS